MQSLFKSSGLLKKRIFFSLSFGVIAKKFSKLSNILSTIFVNFCAKLKRFGSF